MSENLAVSLGPMSDFRVRSLGRMSGHCKAEACFGWVTVTVRFRTIELSDDCPFRKRYGLVCGRRERVATSQRDGR